MVAAGGGRTLHFFSGDSLSFAFWNRVGFHPSRRAWTECGCGEFQCPLAGTGSASASFSNLEDFADNEWPILAILQLRKTASGTYPKRQRTRFLGMLEIGTRDLSCISPEDLSLVVLSTLTGIFICLLLTGRVSFIGKVDSKGYIEVNGSSCFIRRKLESQYMVATIFPHKNAWS